jgi:transposase-like protein
MKILRQTEPTAPAIVDSSAPSPHPESCPWCGQQRVRGIIASTDDPQYRCAACDTTFFVHMPTTRPLVQRRPRA